MSRADVVLQWVRGPAVLDVGCAGALPQPGSPFWLHGRLLEKAEDLWGIDVSAENVERVRELGISTVAVADAQNFSLGRTFDTIVAGEVIEHLENPVGFLRSARRHLKPGGRIVLTTPNVFALVNVVYAVVRFPKTCPNPEHAMWFCASTLHELVRRADLSVEHWELIDEYYPDLPFDPGDPCSRSSRLFSRSLKAARRLLPQRLSGNVMLFVLVART